MTVSSLHSLRARAALAKLPEIDPAIAALALWCSHRDGDSHTYTDADTIWYGEDFVALPLSEQTGCIAHHVMHVTLRHSARQAGMAERIGPEFQKNLYNLAGDAIINEMLIKGAHALPRPAVRLSALLHQTGPQPEHDIDLLAEWDSDKLYLHLVSDQSGKSRRDAAEDYAIAQRFRPDLKSQNDKAPDPELWATRLDQALAAGRSAGIGIGAALAKLADAPTGDTPWEVILRRLLLRAVNEIPRRSYKRPSNRWVAQEADALARSGFTPAFSPGQMRDARQPRIVMALDTSSSITDLQLKLLAGEVNSISRRCAAETHLLGFDTEVHFQERLNTHTKFPQIRMRRGGGTAFVEVVEAATALNPSVLVILTDLDGPVGQSPEFPVIWAVPEPAPDTAPFGQLVKIAG